jgi:hypothetical protein
MAEGKNQRDETRIDWGANAMRECSAEAIEAAISEALTALTGKKLDAMVMNLDFAPAWAGPTAAVAGSTEMLLRIRPSDEGPPF